VTRSRHLATYLGVITISILLLATPASAAKTAGFGPKLLHSAANFVRSSNPTSQSCPRPSLTMYGRAPNSVTGPFQLANGRGTDPMASPKLSLRGFTATCKWRLTLIVHKHDPTVWVTTGTSIKVSPGVIDEFNDDGADGVICAAYYQVDNGFGGAGAQASLASTSCNTDGFTNGESSVVVVNGNLQSGPTTIVAPNQQTWYVSFIEGANVLGGRFTFCSQDPEGQHKTYACIQFDAGPFE
jgi:hypothetical protein